MSDERLVRLENLRRVCNERGLGPGDLSRRYGNHQSYWYALLNEKPPKAGRQPKSFGEKAARKIEAALGLPDRWLDTPHTPDEPPEPPASADSERHWHAMAEKAADYFTQLEIKMLPATFILLVDTVVQIVGEHASKAEANRAFDKLWQVLQHGKSQNKD
jgi:hypothetical protein